MNRTIDEGAIRKLVVAFVLIAVVVIGSVVAVAVTDSDGAIQEQQVIKFNVNGATSGSLYDARYGTYDESDKIIDIKVTLNEGTNASYVVRGSNFPGWGGWTSDYIVMRTTTDSGTGYTGMKLSNFESEWGTMIGGIPSPGADAHVTLSFRVCGSFEWADKMDGTTEFSVEFTTYSVTQYTYSTSITYDANGGSNAPSKSATTAQTVESYPTGTDSITIPTSEPTWEGHTFLGWSSSTSGSPAIKPGSTQQIDKGSDITVYAQWELKISKLLMVSQDETFYTTALDWGTEVSLPTDIPTRSGFTFIGWSATDGSETAEYFAGAKVTLKDDLTLYAVWDMDPIPFTLTFNPNEGTGAPEPMTKTSKDEICRFDIPTTLPTLAGYQCVGWSTVRNGDLEYKPGESIGVPYAEPNETLYAVWMPILTYTLAFDANNGTNAPGNVTGQTIESTINLRVPLDEPVRSGYKFLGWSTDSSASAVEIYAGQSFKLTSRNVTLYAVWEKQPIVYSLKFDANGGEGIPTANAVRTADATASITVPAGIPEWEGHAFQGWSVSKTSTAAEYEAGDTVVLYENQPIVTLYAVWKEMTLYTLAFDANEGTGAPASVTAWSLESVYDMTVPADAPTRENHRFVGWAASSDATAADVERGGSFHMTGPTITLYAVWEWTKEMTFTLAFDAGEGTGAPQSKSGTATAPSLAFDVPSDVPTLAGYEFVGWSLSENADAADYVGGDRIVLTSESTTLHAVWKLIVTYTLAFDANNGQNAPGEVKGTSTEGSCELTVPTTEPARSGFKFLGWSVSKETVTPEIKPGQVLTVTGDVTLYAIWNEIVTFTLSFDANGGEGAPGPVSDSSDAGSCALTIPESVPTRTGSTFLGWSRDSQATESEYQPGDSVTLTVRSLTLYAVWEQYPHVKFTGETELTVLVNSTASSTVAWTPADATVTADGPSWISFDNGSITIAAPASEDVGVLTLTAAADGCTETTWTLTVRAIPPEDAALVTFKGNGATDSYVFVVQGGKLTAPSEPTRDGFSFAGWYTQTGERYDFEAPVTGSMVLVAHWDEGDSGSSVPVAWILAGILAVVIAVVVVRRFI